MMDFMGVQEEASLKAASHPPPSWLVSSPNSKLCDKPLEDLTDQDVMQLTREDCRRYLKEKGMRRPSWNKAQAVQQVLSLRGLCRKRDSSRNGDPATAHKNAKLNQPTSSRMTMFYAGTVAVFEDVPLEKAYAIMLLATSSGELSTTASGKAIVSCSSLSSMAALAEFPQARKASLQRFLQKRRKRFLMEEDSLTEKSPPSESSRPRLQAESFKADSSSD